MSTKSLYIELSSLINTMNQSSTSKFVNGIDVGGTKIELVSYRVGTQRHFEEILRRRIETPTNTFENFVTCIKNMLVEVDTLCSASAPLGVGIPGLIDASTGAHSCNNISILNGKNVRLELSNALQRPVTLGNDSQCFSVSEANGGAADAYRSMLGIILGTGAGSGFCIDGHLLRGANGAAGEWGHANLPALVFAKYKLPLLPCSCGLSGCKEMYVSGTGLTMLLAHLGGRADNAQEVVRLAESGNHKARMALEWHLDIVAQCMVSLILDFDPHAIVLGGGLSNLDYFYTDLPPLISSYLPHRLKAPDILKPHFGAAGGTRGAAILALNALA